MGEGRKVGWLAAAGYGRKWEGVREKEGEGDEEREKEERKNFCYVFFIIKDGKRQMSYLSKKLLQ
ncbi:conserved hypothetical protein [Ricinus communis]|uniref:Uncharacterized protein n=1 Tax=Ricinus communis TaxID=3988 RepID=B9SVP1_RICCO|nr:conserved hypothetical protein [Ricinus communis]